MLKKKLVALVGIVTIAAAALTGCTDSGVSVAGKDGSLTPITVGVIPIVDTAPLWLGVKEGFFKEVGLDVTIKTASGGAAIVPAVVSGEYQIGFSNTLSLMVAVEKGLPLKVVSPAVASTGDTKADFGAIVVRNDSPIKTMADLSGKTVSSNSLGNINDTIVKTLIDQAGADSSKTKFVEVPFPNVAAALDSKQIDAGFVVEPFVTSATAAGYRVVGYNYASFDPKLDVAAYFSTTDYIAKNEKVIKAFQSAMKKSLEFSQANAQKVRDIVATYTKTDPAVLAKMVLPTWPSAVNQAAQQKLADAALKYGALKKAADLKSLFGN